MRTLWSKSFYLCRVRVDQNSKPTAQPIFEHGVEYNKLYLFLQTNSNISLLMGFHHIHSILSKSVRKTRLIILTYWILYIENPWKT